MLHFEDYQEGNSSNRNSHAYENNSAKTLCGLSVKQHYFINQGEQKSGLPSCLTCARIIRAKIKKGEKWGMEVKSE